MIDGLKPYPATKATGVPWLGAMPEHWEVQRLKRVCRFIYGDALPDALRQVGNVPVFGSNGRVGAHATANTLAPCLVIGRKGSFGKVTYSDEPVFAIDTTFFVDRRSAQADIRWLSYLLGMLRLDQVSKDSAVPGLDREDAYQHIGPVPPLDEQLAIVRFLDHADRLIRRYVGARRRLIRLLEEQKQAIVHRAVSRGLDPNVRLKPSGIEWLGEMPAHWEVRKLGRVARVFNGTTPSRGQARYWEGGTIPWLSSGKVNDGIVESASELITAEAVRESSLSMVPRGAVILGLIGQGRTRGMCAQLNIDACINQNLAAIVPGESVDGRFLYYMLTGFYRPIREAGRGGNQAALNCEIVSMLRVPLPPLEQQEAIAEHLERELATTNRALAGIKREIALLQEYRTRLIADVVTGKLDVRAAAEALPEGEPEAMEQADDAEVDDMAPDADTEIEEAEEAAA
jgi:type I restriction enzyme S subunit